MVLYLIGLGLGDAKDITVRGLEIVKRAHKVYLESYTSILQDTRKEMEELYGREVIEADRLFIEQKCEAMLDEALTHEIAVLVVGDVFCATTHCDLNIRAIQKNVQVVSIHNAGIMTAVGCCGLSLYNFGLTVSIPFFTEKWRPYSFYERMKTNMAAGMHTLCLLDIKVKEQSMENLIKGRLIFEPPRFMTVNQAIQQLLSLEEEKKMDVFHPSTFCIGLARVGCPTQRIVAGKASDLLRVDFGGPLHSLIVPCLKTVTEEENIMIQHFAVKESDLVLEKEEDKKEDD
ncbi:diphthine synthase [Monocercomonoides exilis]|uniref:diphthine synthase n=1 Tax=Monocercomonoides exilis TaxID=2049356 RepID=UPI00355A34B8|nr:diphthine synthase [Monocercomonoides exilis]|eukprot:MONOS_262.1-p1 / transcript=MONOS_262.1 / gene=MONOS_262 / organism=Monocercomonoides_exilis_PA203 / gene_product=diphthine synthase / transcript_product=diphthine synthase / location=Mono_scaffold00004:157475-158747(-) / protein_length=287 / sequence_SO=supercontig / SO=protein_coding / is_pseudo=false